MEKRVDYAELVNRNWGFLNPREQEKIRTTRILLAGCGLGGNIAVLAARTGFTRFILADGDKVEVNNLNRQPFRLPQVGKNKAEATAQLVKEINPEAEIEVFPNFITEKETLALVSNAELVVNTVDPSPTLFALNQVARSQNKLTLFPLNVGFGGILLIFSPDSATLEDMVGKEVSMEQVFPRLIGKTAAYLPYVNSYLERFSKDIDDILRGIRPGPQLGIAAAISASLVVTAMVKRVLGAPLKLAPEPLAFDAWIDN